MAALALAAPTAARVPTFPADSSQPESAPAVVRIIAAVTGREGRPVLDLQPRDFQIFEGGVPQKVERVELWKGGQLFVFLLDEFHVRAGATKEVRDAVSRFVDQLGADDLFFVLKPLDPLTSIRFSKDRDAPRSAITSFAGRKGDFTPRSALETQIMAPARAREDRARIVTAGVRELVERIGRVRERRGALVLISEGFAQGPVPAGARPVDAIQAIVRSANRYDVPIYAFVPAGEPTDTTPGDDGGGASMLRALSRQTGGDAEVSGGDVLSGLQKMARELASSYLVSYRPSRALESETGFHPVEVRTTRRGVTVRARPAYRPPSSDAARGASLTRTSPTAVARSRALRRSSLIEPWVGIARGAGDRTRLTLTWQARPRAFGATAGRAEPRLVVVKAATAAGAVLFEGRVTAVGPGGELTGAGSLPSAVFDVPPGQVEIDLTILGRDGAVLDSDARDVEAPDLTGPRAMFPTPHVLRARTAREFRAVSEDPDAPPVPSRDFRRVERLLVRAPAYDAGGATLPVRATLLNRMKQALRVLEPMLERTRGGVAQFDVALAPLARGEYELEFTAPTAGGQALVQRIRFRVTD